MRVDLHMHSTASDGVYSPAEVVQIALTNNMDVIALTDHDSVEGIAEARQAAASSKLDVLVGVELSSEGDQGDAHILGYLFDTDNLPLQNLLSELRGARVHRADRIVQKLSGLGIDVPLERVYALAGSGAVGRPHVARAMVEAGFVGSLQEAFDKYLGDDGPAYVPHFNLTPEDAIRAVHAAGGIAVLAHPGRYEAYGKIIAGLLPLGLDGLEVFYPDHTPAIIEELRGIVRQHDLVMTVGSDFHRREGDGSARIGSVKTPPDLAIVAALRERTLRYRQ
ncbi:MAG: PHP domain-containing protein [Chloroflexota bacterium]